MSNERENQNEIIDIPGMLREYASKWYLFAICIIGCVGLTYIYTKVHQPLYSVRANILISQDDDKGSANGLMANFGDLGGVFGSKAHVDDEVFVVSSHSVLRQTAKDLNLNKTHYVKPNFLTKVYKYQDFPVDVYTAPGVADTLMTTIKFRVKVSKEGKIKVIARNRGKVIAKVESARWPVTVNTDFGKFYVNKTKYFKQGESLTSDVTFAGYDVAAENLDDVVMINMAGKKSNVISLALSSPSTEYAKDLLNTIMANYNTRGIEERNLKSQKTADFIDSRLQLLSGDLETTEKDIEKFKKEQGMTDAYADVTYTLTQKGALEQELVKAQAEAEVLKMLQEFIANPANAYSLMPSTTATADAQDAITAYNNVVLQRMDLARNAKANNVPLKKIDEQLAAMRANLSTSLEKAHQSSMTAARHLESQVNSNMSRIGKMPYQERIYHSILRQQTLKEELYIFLLQRREETSMTIANSVPKGVIIDEAYSLSDPLGMSKSMMLMLAAFVGLCLAPIIIYLRRITRNKFETADELKKLTKVPVLGEICTSRSKETLVVRPGSTSSLNELFALLRTNLNLVLKGNEKVVLMTSTVSGEGKSFVSINLAATLARQGSKVLLIGMDIRKPTLAKYLPIQPKYGLTEYLSTTGMPLSDIIVPDAVAENMDIITAGPVPPNPGEMLLRPEVDELFAKLREMYDYIIIDSAPVGMVSDSLALVRISDATVYVCRANYTTLRDVRFFNELYEDNRMRKMSLVINGTSARKGYGYGYGENVDRKGRLRRNKND